MGNSYELNINLNKIDDPNSISSVMDTTNTGSIPNIDSGDKNILSSKSITAGAVGAAIYSAAKRTVTSVASYELSKTGSVYGDTAKANAISNSLDTVSAGAQMVAIAATAIVNPVAAAVQALMFAADTAMSAVTNHAEYMQTQIDNAMDSTKKTGRLGNIASSKGRTFYNE